MLAPAVLPPAMRVIPRRDGNAAAARRKLPLLEGLLPVQRGRINLDVLAGITLAALAIPEVMGYTQIAGMPVITGLYTILLPILVFALLGSSRHLVVGADSATAAVMAASLAGLAATGSSQYIALAGLLAIMAGALLLVARLARLGFIADFLSRTVLIGFLTGVGIQVAAGQVGGLFGVPSGSGGTIRKLFGTLANLDETSLTTLAVSVSVIAVIIGTKLFAPKVPGALIAVIGSIVVSWAADLSSHGVATLGVLPSGLPSLGLPDVAWSDIPPLLGAATSILVLVLAQSAATSRAYAAKYNEAFSENVDLVGLSAANVVAGVSGAFVVNGSPTKTQMVDGAGGRSQLAQLVTAALVAIVLLFLTAPIQYMPKAVLASVVFIIGIELVDIAGMRRVLRVRLDEFVIAAITAVTVIVAGVEQGIVLAIVLSIVDHLRRSYHPANTVLVAQPGGHWHSTPVTPDARTVPGLVIYRFTASLYYANANRFLEEVEAFTTGEPANRPAWICIDATAIPDVDYTGAMTIEQAVGILSQHHIRLVFAGVMDVVRQELDRLGVTAELGPDAYYATAGEVIEAFAGG